MMDIKEIFEYLPHRYPFLLVDRVVSVESGGTIKGFKNVSGQRNVLQRPLPGKPCHARRIDGRGDGATLGHPRLQERRTEKWPTG